MYVAFLFLIHVWLIRANNVSRGKSALTFSRKIATLHLIINTIILLTKKTIYNAMKKEQQPNIFTIKNDVKNFYFLEKYKSYVKGKGRLFEKQYSLLTRIYANR